MAFFSLSYKLVGIAFAAYNYNLFSSMFYLVNSQNQNTFSSYTDLSINLEGCPFGEIWSLQYVLSGFLALGI